MSEVVTIGNATLIYGNALDVLPTLIQRADCVVTDPPYKLTSGGDGETNETMCGKFGRDQYDNGGSIVACDLDWPDFMPLFFDCLRPQAHAYVMANNRHVEGMLAAARAAGFHFHNLLVWKKPNGTPNRWYMKNCEFVGFFKKGAAKAINDCSSMACMSAPADQFGAHPTQKPVALMEYYIRNSTEPGDTVIDPFMGAGSVCVAALRTERKFIGIEIERRWFNDACRRAELALNQSTLFIEATT